MKPSEHPEFFRFPPPEGRSRESTIVLTKDGRFFHDGAPVEHRAMHQAFASWLGKHPDDGRYVLNNGYDWTYLTVEGALHFVAGVRVVEGRLQVVLLDGSGLPLDVASLACDAEGRLTLQLPGGDVAHFTDQAQLQLAPWLTERGGEIGIELAGEFCRIPGASACVA